MRPLAHNCAIYPFPFGQLKIGYQDGAVTLLTRTEEPAADEGRTPLTDLAFQQISEYLNGQRRTFDFPKRHQCTPFKQKVLHAFRNIPNGETRTYGEIAASVGSPKASRAVGMANHQNPIMIVVPCHRVVGASGKLVGYRSGLEMKQALLQLEKKTAAP